MTQLRVLDRSPSRRAGLRASICIPTYNRREILLRTLQSLNVQTAPPDSYEVIVADDGSSDGTPEMLATLQTRYRLRCVTQPNAGPAAASNTAARLAEHEVLIFLDDDQIASPGLVKAHLDAHEDHGPVLVQGLYPLAPGCKRRGSSLLYDRHLMAALEPIDVVHPMTPHIWSANISVPRSTWAEIGGFDESFREYGGEDTDFGVRAAATGVPVIFVPSAFSQHVHVVGYESMRRQAFAGGRSLVKLSTKFEAPVEEIAGHRFDKPSDRVSRAMWRWSPMIAGGAGRLLTGGLRVADVVGQRPLQLLLARAVDRHYKLGGLETERRSGQVAAGEDEPDPSAGLVHATAEVGAGAVIGPNTRIWSGVQVREGASIGADCTLGKGVYIDRDVVVGDRVKLQNRASVFRGSRIESGVFIGPHTCLLNDKRPRATNGHGSLKADPDWHAAGVTVRRGASIGGGCTVLPGVSVGEYAMVGAGSVVTKNVPAHGLAVGNPARVVGRVCDCGTRIAGGDTCADCGWTNTLEAQRES